jgi:polyhydroxyalkanoate synthesis regulator phasin
MAEKKAAGKAKKAKAGGKAKAQPKAKAKSKAKAKAKTSKAAPKKAAAKKVAAKKTPKAKASSKPTSGLDKSVAQFRESLEQSVTISRDRIQDVVDDAVKRGRITRGDAEKLLGELVKKGRKQTDALLGELERLVRQARREVGGRAEAGRKQATIAARRARRKLG